jgi:hypothetical protein
VAADRPCLGAGPESPFLPRPYARLGDPSLAQGNRDAGHLDVVRELMDGRTWLILT